MRKKKVSAERSLPPSEKKPKRLKKPSDGSRTQLDSEISAAKCPATADVMKRKRKEERIAPKDPAERQDEASGLVLHYGFDERLSGRLPPGHSEPSTATEEESRSEALSCRTLACFCELRIDEIVRRVISFLH